MPASDGLSGAAAAATEHAEAGPSKLHVGKRKYEVDVADRDFCKKVSSFMSFVLTRSIDV